MFRILNKPSTDGPSSARPIRQPQCATGAVRETRVRRFGPVSRDIRTYSKLMHLPATYASQGALATSRGRSMSEGATAQSHDVGAAF